MLKACVSIPPSANRIWRYVGSRPIKSREYRAWLDSTGREIALANVGLTCIGKKCRVTISAERPHASRDLDNTIKPLLDALVASGKLEDDRLVHEIKAKWQGKGTQVQISCQII